MIMAGDYYQQIRLDNNEDDFEEDVIDENQDDDFYIGKISEEEAMAYKAKFMTLDTNYNLHGDFLIYIYKEMPKLSNKFGLFSFQA